MPKHYNALGKLLLSAQVCGIKKFNAKEMLFHIILICEVTLDDHVRTTHSRQHLAGFSFLSNGGLQGLKLFFPFVTSKSAVACAGILRQDILEHTGRCFPDLHDLQWALCLFQKTCNTDYKCPITFDLENIKMPHELIVWKQLLRLPYWKEIKDQVISDGLKKELATFQKALAKGLQPGLRTITSRTCLHISHKHHTSGAAEVIDVRY